MKYIKSFERFDIDKEKPPMEIGTDMNVFNGNEANVKDFNNRKNMLLNIYTTYTEDQTPSNTTPVDLYNKLLAAKFIKPGDKSKVIFINPLFAIYSEFCSKKRQIQNITNTLNQKKNDIAEKQKNISDNTGDRETANNDIQSLNNDIAEQTKNLTQLTKDIQMLQKSSMGQIDAKIKEMGASKKRITDLDNNT